MTSVKEVGRRVYSIDDQLYSLPSAGAVYFLDGIQKALVDTGPSTSFEAVVEGLRQIGHQPADVDYIIITHIHLDHSGGVGSFLRFAPHAKVLAHPRALKHLVDPSRLVASAIEAQGTDFVATNGPVLPIPASQLEGVNDGDLMDLGNGLNLTFLDCPGHAPHEICVLESLNRGLFSGDAVGHYLDGASVMVPVTPPPGFSLDLYLNTLKRLLALRPERIYFAHSGATDQVRPCLQAAVCELQQRERLIDLAASENNLAGAAQIIVQHASSGLGWVRDYMRPLYHYWVNVDLAMSAREHVRNYCKRHHLDV